MRDAYEVIDRLLRRTGNASLIKELVPIVPIGSNYAPTICFNADHEKNIDRSNSMRQLSGSSTQPAEVRNGGTHTNKGVQTELAIRSLDDDGLSSTTPPCRQAVQILLNHLLHRPSLLTCYTCSCQALSRTPPSIRVGLPPTANPSPNSSIPKDSGPGGVSETPVGVCGSNASVYTSGPSGASKGYHAKLMGDIHEGDGRAEMRLGKHPISSSCY